MEVKVIVIDSPFLPIMRVWFWRKAWWIWFSNRHWTN